jgi:fluoroquinolone resistance protein
MAAYHYYEQFEGINLMDQPFLVGEYEECVFSHVNFGGANLTDFNFSGCVFEHCNLSGVRLDGAILRDCKFDHCKMMGLRLETCNTLIFSVSFADCLLDHSSFYQLNLKKMPLLRCSLKEVDFTEADLTEVKFLDCELLDALFDRSNLEKADFSSARHYRIDPTVNNIKKAKFSLDGLPGLLTAYNIDIV